MHSVTYNQDLVSPTLLAGWTKLRDLYELTGNHQVTMTHFERSVFFLAIFKSSSKPKAYPKWHSLYHQVPNSVTFKLLLSEYKVTKHSSVCQILKSYIYIYISNINLMLISRCVKYHVLIYETCRIHPSELGRDYGV